MPNQGPRRDVEPGRQRAHVATLDDDLGCGRQHFAEHPGLDTLKALLREVLSLRVATRAVAEEGAELRRRWRDDDARARTSRGEQGTGAFGRLAADREERQLGILV